MQELVKDVYVRCGCNMIKMKKLKNFLIGAGMLFSSMLPLDSQTQEATTNVVILDPGYYERLSMESDTFYRGNLSEEYLERLKGGLLLQPNLSSAINYLNKNIDYSKYAVIKDASWGGGESGLENLIFLPSTTTAPYLDSERAIFKNNIVIGEGRNGLESDLTDAIIQNNILVNLGFGIQLNADAYGGANITDNFIGWCSDYAIACNYSVNIGDNVTSGNNLFYMNNLNLKIDNYSVPVKAEGQYWYDNEGIFLNNERDILDTCYLQFNPSASNEFKGYVENSSDNKSDYIDVVPFHTSPPYSFFEPPTGVRRWDFYE